MLDFLITQKTLQAVFIAEKLRLPQRYETAWADDNVLERDGLGAETEIVLTSGALFRFGVLHFHAEQKTHALKNLQPICEAPILSASLPLVVVANVPTLESSSNSKTY